MIKTAFLFSGQGAQYVGMGKELYDNYKSAREVFELADETLKMDITSMCFEGPDEELTKTENTQPAIVTVSTALAAVLREHNINADYAAGLSLGEYSALIYGGVFKLEEGLALVKRRGQIMQDAVPEDFGAMAAIMGMGREAIEECCMALKEEGIVEVANYNCPGQVVITGEKSAVQKAAGILKNAGALKTVMLNVSGPFHSSLLNTAGEELEKEIKRVHMNAPKINVISNYDNKFYNDDSCDVIFKLKNQICSSVKWEDNIRRLIEEGVEAFVEVGPGKTLINFVKKIDRTKRLFNVEDNATLEKLLMDFNKM